MPFYFLSPKFELEKEGGWTEGTFTLQKPTIYPDPNDMVQHGPWKSN